MVVSRLRILLAILTFFSVLGEAGAVGVYRWVDDAGRVHFGDRPPPAGGERIEVPIDAPALTQTGENREARRLKLLEAMEEDRQQRESLRRAQAQEKAERKRNCILARERLRALENARYLYDTEAGGERRIYGDAERRRVTEEGRKTAAQWCGNSAR